MSLKIRADSTHALVVPTSMGVRLTPVDRQPVHTSTLFQLQVTSAETNAASVVSYLGLPVLVLTKFVKGSPIARLIKDNLASRHMRFEGPDVEPGGPWGYRHQFNIADTGFGLRGPRVYNDRAGEVGRTLSAKDFDLERIFGREGVAIVHFSGLIAALSSETAHFCLELARTARRYGTCVSFDLNYRASFWKGREQELRAVFTELAGLADILTGNEVHFEAALGVERPVTRSGNDLPTVESSKVAITRVLERFPSITVCAATLREELSVETHRWGVVVAENGTWHVVEPREIPVLDRIGGGDAFVGGMLYGILRGWQPERWVQFGWAAGALAVTMLSDYAQPADEEQIWNLWRGNARVER